MVKINHSKTLFKNQFLELKENYLDFGESIFRKHVDFYRSPAVSIFPIDKDNNLYLIRHYRYLIEREIIEAPAGIIEKGESTIATARRELKEETGIIAKTFDEIKKIYSAGSFAKIEHRLVLAKELKFEKADPEETEKIEVIKVKIEEAINLIDNDTIVTAATIVGILLIDKMLKRENL